MEIHICIATPNDFEAIYSFVNELENQTFNKEKQEYIYHQNIQQPNNIYLVAFDDHAAVGYISCHAQNLLHHSGLIGEIQEMFVTEKYRSSGIGKLLMENLIHLAKQKGYLQLEVTSGKRRVSAHRFYLREGFSESHFKFTRQLFQR